ncbi:MAG: hypothetical protein ACI9WU_003539 [Myxococcota bacterium]|jgi:hypothetical protein
MRWTLSVLLTLAFVGCGDDPAVPSATGGTTDSAEDVVASTDSGADADATDGTDDSGGTTGGETTGADVIEPDGGGDTDADTGSDEDATTGADGDVVDPPDDGPPAKVCPPECDDGRPCTVNTCDDNGECLFPVQDDACLIANVCYEPGWAHSNNACVACDPTQSQTEWSLALAGTLCGQDDPCLEGGECLEGQCSASPVVCTDQNDCTDDFCDPQFGCVSAENFDACEDGDPCTLQDFCAGGQCVPSLLPLVCADGQACTNDVCGPDGCLFIAKAGGCSDGTECTVDDFCEKGDCKSGPPLNCDDGNVCTVDLCDPFLGCGHDLVDSACCITGISLCDDQNPCTNDQCNEDEGTCHYTPNTAGCDDGLACTGPDLCANEACSGEPKACDDSNNCTADSCSELAGGCVHEPVENPCDDGNACTVDDGCLGGTCTGAPLNCSDGEACTQDTCDPLTGCVYLELSGVCNDSNACTTGDVCTPAGCTGSTLNCGDGNPCTNDSCHPAAGCQYQPVGAACDDGLDCSTNDSCQAGQCVADVSDCGCLPEFSDVMSKFTDFGIGPDGYPGNGLDVDKNPDTCTPNNKCSDGIDNILSAFAFIANEPLGSGVGNGDLVLMFEHQDFKSNGQLYTINFYPGDTLKNDNCDFTSQVCDYLVDQSGLNEDTCVPLIQFDNAKIVGGNQLVAGGIGYSFPLDLPVNDNAVIPMNLSNAQIKATVVVEDGKVVSMTDGVLAGAVAKETMLEGIELIPDADLEEIGFTKSTLKALINAIVQNDIDLDADGNADAASIGLFFDAIAGNIVGIKL